MFLDYARYYTTLGLQLLTAYGIIKGGPYAWLGLSTLFVLALVDALLPDDLAVRQMNNRTLANIPVWICTVCGPALILVLAWQVGLDRLSGWSLAGAIISVAWMSVIAFVPPSHELYHQRGWLPQFIGTYFQVCYLDCARNIGHTVGHHIDVGTDKDSDTARRGVTLYAFTANAVLESTLLSWRIESDALEKRGYGRWSWRHRLWKALLAQVVFQGLVYAIGGGIAVLVVLTAMVISRFWVESFNYFQHYGIVRLDGKPVARRHLWNHLGFFTRPVAFEITNHADHHLDSYIPYYKLKPDQTAIHMPNVFLCFLTALIPPLWHRMIIKRALKEWDLKLASAEERELARQQNLQAGWPDWFATAKGASA
ncbi:MAG: alkane 1-monooxygenase [Gammaproteobacteria bacterium]|nr:alkane 1-monooxygenase [Gammaproteobacteria bacterium]